MAAILMLLFSAFMGRSPYYPLQAIGWSVVPQATTGVAVAAGLLIHQLGPSLFWGAAFGLVVWATRPTRGASLLLLGLLCGAMAQVVDVTVVLPAIVGTRVSLPALGTLQWNNSWSEHVPVLVSWIGHLTFGLALSIYPWSYDPLARTFD
jgi:hypothetical protein